MDSSLIGLVGILFAGGAALFRFGANGAGQARLIRLWASKLERARIVGSTVFGRHAGGAVEVTLTDLGTPAKRAIVTDVAFGSDEPRLRVDAHPRRSSAVEPAGSIPTGDPAFDARFFVGGAPRRDVIHVLGPRVREALSDHDAEIVIGPRRAVLRRPGGPTSLGGIEEWLAVVAELSMTLAAVEEELGAVGAVGARAGYRGADVESVAAAREGGLLEVRAYDDERATAAMVAKKGAWVAPFAVGASLLVVVVFAIVASLVGR